MARGPNLLGSDSEEVELIDEILEPISLAVYGNGEISHDRFYRYTGALTLFTQLKSRGRRPLCHSR